MNWSKDVPIKTGYYWAYEALPSSDADVVLVEVMMQDDKLVGCSCGLEDWDLADFSHWTGPLDVPPPPEDA